MTRTPVGVDHVTLLVRIIVLPLLVLLAVTASRDAPAVIAESAYVLVRVELFVAVALIVTALAVTHAAWQARVQLGTASLGVVVACSLSGGLGIQPGLLTANSTEAAGAVLIFAALTGGLVALARDRSAGYLAFTLVLFSAACAASWQVAVPPFIARIVVQH